MSRAARTRVMVVDDDVIVLEVTREILEEAGYEVITRDAAIGTGAAILREKPAYVLLDVHMPGLSGDAVATLLSHATSEDRPAIILHSGADREELLALARRCGAIGIIEKTPHAQHFMQQLAACVAARRPLAPWPER